MMHRTQGWNGLRFAVIALGLIVGSTTGAKADAITNLLEYSTAGSIDTSTGVTGPNVISYVPVTNATVDATSNLPLGSFQVAGIPGQTTTYINTPFTITFAPNSYDGTALTSTNGVEVTGTLNGTINGPYQSNVTVDNLVASGPITFTGASSTLSILQNDQKLLVPSSAGGTTTLEGIIATTGINEVPAPEPSTIALFLSTVGGLGLRRYVLARRQRRQA
jgi:hypothetical protein